jgi:type VI secretion system Hcp family effector
MTKNKKLPRRAFGRIASGAAILLLTSSAPLLFLAPGSMAAVDAYLKIPGIDGGSKDAAHLSWITVSSITSGDLKSEAQMESTMSIGSQSSGSGAGKVAMQTQAQPHDAASGMSSGKRMHQPLVITKEIDKASPKLAEAVSSGQHFNEVDVDMGGSHYKLYDVMLAVRKAGGGGDRPMETVTFTYQKIEMK